MVMTYSTATKSSMLHTMLSYPFCRKRDLLSSAGRRSLVLVRWQGIGEATTLASGMAVICVLNRLAMLLIMERRAYMYFSIPQALYVKCLALVWGESY